VVVTVGGRAPTSLSAADRATAGVGGGDEVDVGIVLDDAPREVLVSAELAAGPLHVRAERDHDRGGTGGCDGDGP
jgi:hypothetical protein